MIAPQTLASGTVSPLVRRLTGAPDPLALYRALTDGGARPHTVLLEASDAATGMGERSIIATHAALYLEAGPSRLRIEALTPNGEAALAWLAGIGAAIPSLDSRREAFVSYRPRPDLLHNERYRFRQPSPLDVVRTLVLGPELTSAPTPFAHLLLGAFGYDLIDYFESLPEGRPDPLRQPVLEAWVPEGLLVIDHLRHQVTAVTTVWGGEGAAERYHDASRLLERLVKTVESEQRSATTIEPSMEPGDRVETDADIDDDEFAELVRRLKRYHHSGDVYQIVPSRTFTAACPDPLAAYARLRAANPSPHQFYLKSPHHVLFGASPETCLRVDGPTRRVAICPIAGTALRGRTPTGTPDPEADARNEAALRADTKELAEHLMLVDLARNDIARVSQPGTRRVARLLDVERYSHVMHLVSEVEGTLDPAIDALEAYAATMNMGTLVGAPKVRAATILREAESSRRGFYGGAVGYLTHDGSLETAIVIRSAFVAEGLAHVRAGAGVVLDSVPANEARETAAKARAVLRAITTPELAHV
jgi:anthranilate synthase component 1